MKSTSALSLASLASVVTAFPSLLKEITKEDRLLLGARQQAPDPSTRFNAAEQYVSNTGDHAFIAPGPTDQRGPCPGLNAMGEYQKTDLCAPDCADIHIANHGYLPRNGVGSHLDFIQGTFDVFGMSADLSGFLTV